MNLVWLLHKLVDVLFDDFQEFNMFPLGFRGLTWFGFSKSIGEALFDEVQM